MAEFLKGEWCIRDDDWCDVVARVLRTWPDGTMDLVLYDHAGNRIGRRSPRMGGPKGYEPCCPQSRYRRISKPEWPLEKRLDGGIVACPSRGSCRNGPWSRLRRTTWISGAASQMC